jgi:hypothetical protein
VRGRELICVLLQICEGSRIHRFRKPAGRWQLDRLAICSSNGCLKAFEELRSVVPQFVPLPLSTSVFKKTSADNYAAVMKIVSHAEFGCRRLHTI